jgi:hypothetical protein
MGSKREQNTMPPETFALLTADFYSFRNCTTDKMPALPQYSQKAVEPLANALDPP